jgi:hypothetical protein
MILNMTLRTLFSRICLVAMLLVAVALPSAALAHESHEHATEHAAIAGSPLHKSTPAQAFASPGETGTATLSRASSTLDSLCNGVCCGGGSCGGCTMALAEDDSLAPPFSLAGTRIPLPRTLAGPGAIPEALPRPPRSFA